MFYICHGLFQFDDASIKHRIVVNRMNAALFRGATLSNILALICGA